MTTEADIRQCFHKPRNTEIASTPPGAGVQAGNRFSPTDAEGTSPADTLILDF